MKRIRRLRPSPSMVVALIALAVAAGGVTYAAIPDTSGVIHGCFSKAQGALRVIDTESSTPAQCKSNETALSWPARPGPGSGDRVVSGLIRLSVGETKTVVQRGPFTVTANCADRGPGNFLVTVDFLSSEAGTAYDGVDAPLQANTPFNILSAAGTAESRDQTFAHIVAPSGATWGLFASAGVHTFGSECAAAATAMGL